MPQKLVGKVAAITGGGGGIGREVALALVGEGASVVVNDLGRDAEGTSLADKAVDEITGSGGSAVANYDTVATMRGGENVVKTAVSTYGRLDILVNCAGNFKRVLLPEMTEEHWDSIIDVHLKGHFSCTRAAVPEMLKQGRGRIINISSRGSFRAVGGALAYSAAKSGIMGFSSTLAVELREQGITVNCIVPAADTPLFPGRAPRGKDLPAAKSLDPSFVAPTIAYLCTDEAQEITGQFLYVAGGDVCVYDHPLRPLVFIRKVGKWTVDELAEAIPPLYRRLDQ